MNNGKDDTERDLVSLGLLASTLGVSARVYHIGFIVPDINEAVATMQEVLQVPFCPPKKLPFTQVETPQGPVPIELSISYSTRPCHVELIQADAGTMYDFDIPDRCYHLGVWAENMESEMERLAKLGMPPLWWGRMPDGSIPFSFHRTPFGFFIELVDGAFRYAYLRDWTEADPALVRPAA